MKPRSLPCQWRKWLKLRRVHFPGIQNPTSAAGATAGIGEIVAAGVDNGAEVEKLGARVRDIPRRLAVAVAASGGGFAGEEADATVGSEGLLVGGVAFPASAAVDEGGEGNDGDSAGNGGNGDAEELAGG